MITGGRTAELVGLYVGRNKENRYPARELVRKRKREARGDEAIKEA